jgi:antitoxin (DNA-binding transcriptional repressor) of toxin-antitoxin stability system
MQRMTVRDAERDFANVVNRVYSEGVGVELERGDKVIARLTPASPRSPLKVKDLNTFLQSLPRLGDDAEAFSEDIGVPRKDKSGADNWIR